MENVKTRRCESGERLKAEEVRWLAERYYAWIFGEEFSEEEEKRLEKVERFCEETEKALYMLSCWKEFGFFDGDTAYQELRMKRSWLCAMALAVYSIFVLSTQKRWLLRWFEWVFGFELDAFEGVARHYGIDWHNWRLSYMDPPPWQRSFDSHNYTHEQRWFIYGVWYCAKQKDYWGWWKHADKLEERLEVHTEPEWFCREDIEAVMSDGAPLHYLPKVFQ